MLYLQGGLYSELVFNTGLIVFTNAALIDIRIIFDLMNDLVSSADLDPDVFI